MAAWGNSVCIVRVDGEAIHTPLRKPQHKPNQSNPHPQYDSAYFLANIVLETALNSFNGLLYALIVYFNLDYATFTRPESVAANFGVRT